MTNGQLLAMIRRIMESDGTEEEIDALTEVLEAHLHCPRLTDLMFYSKPELTPEQVLEQALAYKPIALRNKMPE